MKNPSRKLSASDGGHFENTAAYELIRRRLPIIVICDNGCDTERTFDDFGNLIRKVRTDFQTEIRVLGEDDPVFQGEKGLTELVGSLDALRKDPGPSSRHAALAEVTYTLTGETGWIVLLKPGLTGDEPTDVRNYWHNHRDFRHQSTLNQFYDEAQRESYRALGEHVAEKVFGNPAVRGFLKLPQGLGRSVPSPPSVARAHPPAST